MGARVRLAGGRFLNLVAGLLVGAVGGALVLVRGGELLVLPAAKKALEQEKKAVAGKGIELPSLGIMPDPREIITPGQVIQQHSLIDAIGSLLLAGGN